MDKLQFLFYIRCFIIIYSTFSFRIFRRVNGDFIIYIIHIVAVHQVEYGQPVFEI